MTNQVLKNKKIVISAGAAGIGLAIAQVCISKGATVYLCDINEKSISKLKKHRQYKKRLFIFKLDASNESEVQSFFKNIKRVFLS